MKFFRSLTSDSVSSTASCKSISSSSSSRSSKKPLRSRGEFIADSMKHMSSHDVIEMLEMYGSTDGNMAMDCLQSLKVSPPVTSKKHRSKSKRSSSSRGSTSSSSSSGV
ncbi:expressed unknown protein [Seminavis robusta]|uniref:Uncharacterized protein n=1 Tax=Seminavis robusta TaxID=568900 RepID=A0A9N8HL16_9STRA|nr:expressed unknown protein [Seminavis robusta]|eukprot:Sro652_g181790.1 n/a (109) ;mRNA; f:26957-27283